MTGVKATLKRVVRTKKFAVILASTVSAAGGAVGGYQFAVKRLTTKFEARLDEELRVAKTVYEKKYKEGEYSDPNALAEKYLAEKHGVPYVPSEGNDDEDDEPDTDMVAQAVDILEKHQHVSYNKIGVGEPVAVEETTELVTVERNVFDTSYNPDVDQMALEFDSKTEGVKREAGNPYIITEQEFMDRETGDETQLTWYEGDGVLADEHDRTINNIDGVLGGMDNIRFGYGSNDDNIVYICNPTLDAFYEVVRSTGSFSEEKYPIRHSDDSHRIRKMRPED